MEPIHDAVVDGHAPAVEEATQSELVFQQVAEAGGHRIRQGVERDSDPGQPWPRRWRSTSPGVNTRTPLNGSSGSRCRRSNVAM